MKIQSLKMRGAIGIKKGMGLDEINIDLSRVPGLVAMAGPNGNGKTTVLESLSPFRSFASRAGSMSSHYFLRDSFREMSFAFDGNEYLTLVKMNPESDRSEGFIWKNGASMVNGKVSEYDRYIEELLGSETLFYNSVFCAQNGQKLSDMRVGELKKLFIEFLRLDRLAGYEATAKQIGGVLSGMSGQIEKNITTMEAQIEGLAYVDERLQEAHEQKKLHEQEVSEIKVLTDRVKDEIKEFADIESKNSVRREQVELLLVERDILKCEGQRLSESHLKSIKIIEEAIEKKNVVLNGAAEVLADTRAILWSAENLKLLENELYAHREKEYRSNGISATQYEEEASIDQRIDAIRMMIHDKKENPEIKECERELAEIITKKSILKQQIIELERDRRDVAQSSLVKIISSEISANERQAELLLKRPAGCKIDECQFIQSAIKAREKIKELTEEKKVEEKNMADSIRIICGEIDRLNANMEELSTEENELNDLHSFLLSAQKDQIKYFDDRLNCELSAKNFIREAIESENSARAKNFEKINEVSKKIEETKKLSERFQELKAAENLKANTESRIKELEAGLTEKRKEYSSCNCVHRSKIIEIEKRIGDTTSLIDYSAPAKIEELKKELEAMEYKIIMAKDDIDLAGKSIAVLSEKLEEKKSIKEKIDAAKKELSHVNKETSQWLYLQYGCGKNGLQALEIDGVAPLIAHHANTLLNSSFGPNFSVKIITQDQETGKETFDILVIRQDGSEVSFKKLSGGEKVWILKSIRLAMTIISKEKSGRNFQTLLADEEDGPLDAEKSISFIGLYRSIIEVGGFDTCLFISHNPDVVSMADHEIRFSNSGIEIL